MYCSACGQQMDGRPIVCPKCGQQFSSLGPYCHVRVHRDVHTLAILWIVYSFWVLLQWTLAVGFLTGAFNWSNRVGHSLDGFGGFPFLHLSWLAPLITAILIGRAILCAITGISLLRRAPWARTLAIVTAFLTLIRPLTGTALAIYTLWVLLPFASGQEYDQIAVQQGA
jgi:hypothetical protein